jgi:hypothetical protein
VGSSSSERLIVFRNPEQMQVIREMPNSLPEFQDIHPEDRKKFQLATRSIPGESITMETDLRFYLRKGSKGGDALR